MTSAVQCPVCRDDVIKTIAGKGTFTFQCPLCFEEDLDEDILFTDPCGHIFCKSCWDSYVAKKSAAAQGSDNFAAVPPPPSTEDQDLIEVFPWPDSEDVDSLTTEIELCGHYYLHRLMSAVCRQRVPMLRILNHDHLLMKRIVESHMQLSPGNRFRDREFGFDMSMQSIKERLIPLEDYRGEMNTEVDLDIFLELVESLINQLYEKTCELEIRKYVASLGDSVWSMPVEVRTITYLDLCRGERFAHIRDQFTDRVWENVSRGFIGG